jgi:hypothetical protein
MKRRLLVGLSITALLVFSGYAILEAAQNQTAATQAANWKDLAAQKAQQDLSSRSWTIYVWPSDAKGAAGRETDTLTFSNGKVTSKNLSGEGYPESNYGLFIGDDGSVSWETMQARETKEIDLAFLSGQLFSDGTMKGSITMKPAKGAKRFYTYSTQLPGAEPATSTATSAAAPAKKGRR